jgi:hypothetical protein
LKEDLTKQQQEQKRASWHLFEKAKVDKMKAYWCGADLYINDTKVTLSTRGAGTREHYESPCGTSMGGQIRK